MDNEDVAYVELCGLTLSGARAPVNGLYWTNLEGWWGLPDKKMDSDSVPGANGRFQPAQVFRDARVMALTGHILVDSRAEMVSVRHRLEAALAAGIGDMRVVTAEYGAWTRSVVIDTLDVEPDHGKLWVKFTVDMVANDPARYQDQVILGPAGLPIRSGGMTLPQALPWNLGTVTKQTLEVNNTGDVAIYPIMTLRGSASSIEVRGGAQRVSFGAFDGELVFDSDSRRAYLNGAEVTTQVLRRDWPVVQPREVALFSFEAVTPSADLNLSVEYRIGAW